MSVSLVTYYLGVIKSVLASFFGVQSSSQYQKDADSPSFVPFVVVGVLMTVILILSIVFIVSLVV